MTEKNKNKPYHRGTIITYSCECEHVEGERMCVERTTAVFIVGMNLICSLAILLITKSNFHSRTIFEGDMLTIEIDRAQKQTSINKFATEF